MKRPLIGITTNLLYRSSSLPDGKYITNNNQEYELSIIQSGGLPILLPPTTDSSLICEQVNLCDGFILAGGDDINPLLYGEEPHHHLGETHLLTDTHHLLLAKEILTNKKPILAICRGMQVLNIACGGNVYQDLSCHPREHYKHSQVAPRDQVCHSITTEEDTLLHSLLGDMLDVNSFHHQAIQRVGHDLIPCAWSKDGIIEGVELPEYPFAIGVQWHPEIMLQTSHSMAPLFEAFIHACSTNESSSEVK